MWANEDFDIFCLRQALTLAQIRRGFCAPNPSVGAVIVQNQKIIATGFHFAPGHAHAEIDALKKLTTSLKDATIYVTLEPCCHFGRTPPCTDALIQSGITRVVYGYRDPNPIVAGKGEAALLTAGIQCEYLPIPEIQAFYESYHHWIQTKTPFVTAKISQTLDGKIAGPDGNPIPISGASLNEFTHLCRKTSDAILTTVRTIIHDDPQLNARYQDDTIPKPLYILDSQLQLPVTSKIFKTAQSITVFHVQNAPAHKKQALSALGVCCVPIALNSEQKLDLHQLIEFIGKEGVHDLWVEVGGTSLSSFINHKLLKKLLVYVSPWVAGPENLSTFHGECDFRNSHIQWRQVGQDVLCEIHW